MTKIKLKDEKGTEFEVDISLLKELGKKVVEKNWRADKNGIYFHVDNYGDIIKSSDTEHRYDDYRYNTLNYTKTEKESEAKGELQLAIGEVTRAINEANGDWEADWGDRDENKHYIYYCYDNDKFISGSNSHTNHGQQLPYMKTKGITTKIIEDYQPQLKLIYGK